MERITAPIARHDHGPAVGNLQQGLILLLTAGDGNLLDDDRRALLEGLAAEQPDQGYGDATTKAVAYFQEAHAAEFDLPLQTGEVVDEPTAAALNRVLADHGVLDGGPVDVFVVSGRVEYEDGSPAAGLRVAVFDRDLGANRTRLDNPDRPAVTGDDGAFPAVRYPQALVAPGEGRAGPTADLVFEVGAADGPARPIAALYRRPPGANKLDGREDEPVPDPALGLPADPVTEVRIVLAGRPRDDAAPEYGRLMRDLEPLLLDGATPSTFDQERFHDVDFSARESGWDRALVDTAATAWRLATGASPEPQALAETFYGLLRHGPPTSVAPLPADLPGLLERDGEWPVKLEDSLAWRIIGGDLELHLGRLRDLRTAAAMRPSDGRRASPGQALTAAGLSEEDARALLSAYHARTGSVESFWGDAVPHQLGWDADRVRQAQHALQLADIVSYDPALLAGLRDKGLADPRQLLDLSRDDWTAMVTAAGPAPDAPGDTPEERVARTVDAITAVVDATYPTEVMARVAASSADPALTQARDLLARFFERETGPHDGESFDITTSPVTAYLEDHADRVFDGLDEEAQALLRSQLQRLQRVFRLGVNRDQTQALLDLGLDSAFHVARFSQEHFVAEYGESLGGAGPAALIYGRAEKIAGTITFLYADLWHTVHAPPPMMLRDADHAPAVDKLKDLPTYKALFGSLEMCDCEHCRSIYSPAAYFVDLLHMLDHKAKTANPLDELLRRRPDLAHIQLTCENTNTLIPYIDLVTEVLESFVANRAPVAFNVPPPPPHHTLPSPPAEELRVNPVYLTQDSQTFAGQAYAALQEAVFPLSLPLNLPLETARTYLDDLGASRADLMRALDRDPGFEALMALAAEVLRLSPEEFEILTAARFDGSASLRPATEAELFGLTTTGSPATVFNHATPELALNPAAPDDRAPSIRSVQNILGLLSPTPLPVTGVWDPATVAAVNAFLVKAGLPANGRTDDTFWAALNTAGFPSLPALLCPVPSFLARAGLSYDELVALVKTRFVNPALQGEGDLDYLARLGIPGADVRAWIAAGLPALPAAMAAQLAAVGEDPAFFTEWVTRRTRAVVINTAADDPCDLDRATLLHLDGTPLSAGELTRLFRFIRLWRKLGWMLEEMDLVLEPGSLEDAAVFNTVLLLANARALRDALGAPVPELVALWQPIPVHGERPLYDRLFRNRAAQLLDPVLALNRGRTELLAAEGPIPPVLSDHLGPVLAALGVSAPELAALREATGLVDAPGAPALLNLATLSALYRRVALARALRLQVRDLLALVDLSGLDVFERPDRQPRGQALAFLDLVHKVAAAGVRVADLAALCRPPAPRPPRDARTLATIVDGLRALAAEEPVEDDPSGEALTGRLTALLGPDDARATVDLIYGHDVYRARLAGLPDGFAFPAAVAARAAYNAPGKELSFRGAMTAGDRAALLAAPGVPAAVQPAYNRAVAALDAQARAFVARALNALYTPAEAEAALVDTPSLDAAAQPLPAAIRAKILDVLARRRAVLSRGLIARTLATATGLPDAVVSLLLQNASVLTSTTGAGPAMGDYLDVAGDGLDTAYFATPDLADPPVVQQTDPGLGLDPQGAAPAAGFSVRRTGQIYVPAAGQVTFHARCTDGVRLWIDNAAVIDEWQDQPESEFTRTVRLDGGQFYPLRLEYYSKTGDALLEFEWSSPAIPAGAPPTETLYTAARLDDLLRRTERMARLAVLLTPFNLSAHELQALSERGDVRLDALPPGGPVPLAVAQAMAAQWVALADCAALRDRFSSPDLTIVDVPAVPAEAVARFAALSGASAALVNDIVAALTVPAFDPVTATWGTDAPDLSQLSWWRRIADVLALAQQTGATPAQLLAWAKAREIRQAPAGPETAWFTWMATDAAGASHQADNGRLAQAARDAVRARFDEERWRAEARMLNDALRERRRAALVAFTLALPEMARAHVADSGRLFEFLLIDPDMSACLDTSRIKQGISSVQLFIDRIRLNLEPRIPPGQVDRPRWEWMKTYRVWEANLRVFVTAEDYVEESLRDDKTPLFREFESELLQDELSEANVERAVRHYLEKLDGIAKLVICGACLDGDASRVHVFARTANAPYAFYYRHLDAAVSPSWNDGVWSPWEKLPVDVAWTDDGDDSGAHLLPVLWNRRLYLFWPVFEQHPDDFLNAALPEGFDGVDLWRMRLAWSEYQDGRWSPKQLSTPYVVSPSLVQRTSRDVTPVATVFRPVQTIITTTLTLEVLGYQVAKYQVTDRVVSSRTITYNDDPMLSGIVLAKDGDWASHRHHETGDTVLTLLPKPMHHTLEAQVDGDALALRVLVRFSGKPEGQFRTIKEDKLTVVVDGKRTDRSEKEQIDGRTSAYVAQEVFRQVGEFHFPACTANLQAATTAVDLPFNSLRRPQDTTNAFLALANPSSAAGLRLFTGAAPILKVTRPPYGVVDSDDKANFSYSSPFFFQDAQRCYFVTRSLRPRLFDKAAFQRVEPDLGAVTAEHATALLTLGKRQASVAPGAPVVTNPWAVGALERWSAGPGLPPALRQDPPPMHTLSGTFPIVATNVKDGLLQAPSWRADRPDPEYTFAIHWHPHTCDFLSALAAGGLPGLYTVGNQALTDAALLFGGPIGGPMPIFTITNFDKVYKPDPDQVVQSYPVEDVDFSRGGSHAKYNWEIFFDIPLAVARAYADDRKFEDALHWLNRVFDPMNADAGPERQRVWRFLPFQTADTDRIQDSLQLLSYTGSDPALLKRKASLEAGIQDWLAHPFNPHAIARRRPVVYMNFVFMQYVETLLAWADDLLLSKPTIEGRNEATQLLIVAANLLGPRPQHAPAPGGVAPKTFQELRGSLNALSNAQADLETRLPFAQLFTGGTGLAGALSRLPQSLYFCVPPNDKLLAYWDQIVDRLFKIRNCMNLDGTVVELPLWEPPIDPMAIVEALAHGLDIGSVVEDLYAPLPRYTFKFMLQQALGLADQVRAMSNSLLSVLERRDAEKLAALRAEQERLLLDQVKANKKRQIDEAEEQRKALEQAERLAQGRIEYYQNLIAQGLIPEENDQLGNLDTSNERQETASEIEATAQALNLIPNVSVGTGTSVSFGGSNLGAAVSAVSRSYSYLATSYGYKANRSSITGGHARRAEEWHFQRDQATRELSQVQRQKAAAALRRAIAEADLRNHELQIDHARAVEELLRTKFTNEELYSHHEAKLGAAHYQLFRLAYETAKAAERAWQNETGKTSTRMITYGAWDSSVRGLLAGERLYLQLKQMERAYLEQPPALELTKDVSLLQLDPLQLIALKETGVCEVDIPEWLFDLDYPGHYLRRLKSVTVTIPAVVGPHRGVNATLTLLSSKVRPSSRVTGAYGDDDNYRVDHLPVQAIAASTGQNDGGRFVLDFRDDKVLPFEGAGAISRWRIELPRRYRSWDYDTMTDVLLQLKLTAFQDGLLVKPALDALDGLLNAAGQGALLRYTSLQHEFPSEWHRLRTGATHTETITLDKSRFPLLVQMGAVTVTEVHAVLLLKEPRPAVGYKATLTAGALAPVDLEWPAGDKGRYRQATQAPALNLAVTAAPADNGWTIHLSQPLQQKELDNIKDVLLVARYTFAA